MKKTSVFIAALITALLCTASMVMAGNIVIKGSTTVLPITQKVAEAYMKEFPTVTISISGGGSGNGIKAIIDKTTDIANSSRFIQPKEVEMAVANGSYPVPFAVAYDCIIPVVHPSNPIKDITLAQLKDIYEGKVKNWKELGGEDWPLVIVSRDTSSGTYEVWSEKVLKKARVTPAALLQASNGAVSQAVSKNKNAIGYLGVGYLSPGVKPLTVEGVVGSAKTALDGSFPVSRALFMFTNGWPAGEVLNFVNYLIHPEKGQRYVKEAGFVPLY